MHRILAWSEALHIVNKYLQEFMKSKLCLLFLCSAERPFNIEPKIAFVKTRTPLTFKPGQLWAVPFYSLDDN